MGGGNEHPMERRETRQMVRRCIDQLPESYRSVLLLRDIEELDSEEAADMLAITPNAAKIRLHRARQALKTLIEKELCDSNQFHRPNLD
jgi:RNA polymerase sigma-70 factor, ECF subfamily